MALSIPAQYEILLVLALGKPKEIVVVDPVGSDGSITYSARRAAVHHVPKRDLRDIIIGSEERETVGTSQG